MLAGAFILGSRCNVGMLVCMKTTAGVILHVFNKMALTL